MSYFSWVKKKTRSSLLTFSISLEARYTVIRSSLSLLFSRVGGFNLASFSLYCKSFKHVAILVPILCISSIFLVFFILCNDHASAAYSNLGRIIDTINFQTISSSKYVTAILIFLSMPLHTQCMCVCYSLWSVGSCVGLRSLPSLKELIDRSRGPETSHTSYTFIHLLKGDNNYSLWVKNP